MLLLISYITNCFHTLFVIIGEQEVDPEASEIPIDGVQRGSRSKARKERQKERAAENKNGNENERHD